MWDYRQLLGYNLLGIFKQQYYLADELVDDIVGAGHNVTRTVYAEAHAFHGKDGPDPETTALYAPLGEAVFAQGVAAQFASSEGFTLSSKTSPGAPSAHGCWSLGTGQS